MKLTNIAIASSAITGLHGRAFLQPTVDGKTTLDSVQSNLDMFALQIDAKMFLHGLVTLSTTNELDYLFVSNKVACLTSKDIIDVIAMMQENRDAMEPKTRAIIMLYDIIYRRGTPAWATLFSVVKLGDYYTYNSADFPDEASWILQEQQQLQLTTSPSDAERDTFATIQLDLCRRLEPQQAIDQIEKTQRMADAGLINVREYDLLTHMKGYALLKLGRVDEARQIFTRLYNRAKAGKLDAHTALQYINDDFDGVEPYIEHHMKIIQGNAERESNSKATHKTAPTQGG